MLRHADLDGSRSVDFADLVVLLSHRGACGVRPGDLDVDGTVGVADMTTMLARRGACP